MGSVSLRETVNSKIVKKFKITDFKVLKHAHLISTKFESTWLCLFVTLS